MTFTQWYKATFNEEWHEDYGLLYSFVDTVTCDYEKWCEENDVKEVYDG